MRNRLPAAIIVHLLTLSVALASPVLKGVVLDANGEPVPGATVSIQTATPKVGVPILCPSCYTDCGRNTRTDDAGAFRFERVDPALRFTALAVAEGYRPARTKFADPETESLTLTLERRPDPVEEPGRVFRGRVVNLEGEPVPAAVVQAGTYHWEEGRGSSRLDGADTVVVARDDGTFELTFPRPLVRIGLRVSAKGYANRHLDRIRVSPERYDFVIGPGAIITGTIVDDEGRPVVGRAVGLCGTDRAVRVFDGHWTIATDERGVFTFTNLPASGQPRLITETTQANFYVGKPGVDVRAFVYTKIADADGGSIAPLEIPVPKHNEAANLGTLTLTDDALRVSGRVVLLDDEGGTVAPIPEGARLMISRDHAWDSAVVEIDKTEGRFDVLGVWGDEPVQINVNVPGYRLSTSNPGYHDSWQSIVGRPTREPLTILLEPGPLQDGRAETDWQLRSKPLRSPAVAPRRP